MRRFLYIIACMLISAQLLAQTRVVTGTITDNNGVALPYVNVKVAGGTAATTTNVNGVFTLTVPQNATKLEVSYVGYATQQVDIPENGPVSISMIQTANAMNEVVVTGYRSQKRSEYAGAVSKVDAKEVNHVPFGSFDQILQGRAAGLTVLSGSGQPGDASTVILRGPTSIQGGSDPLYVVDGIPIEAGAFQNINPNDIATVDVLKDATAAALYGSRGAPGVIVITTKRGKAGRMKIGYSAQYGRKAPPHFNYEMMTSQELLQAQEDLGLQLPTSSLTEWGEFPNMPGWQYSPKNGFKSVNNVIMPKTPADVSFSARQLDSLRQINTDWNDEFFRTGTFNNHEINFSGGTGKTLLYSNLSYYSEQGTSNPSDMKRVTLRTNMDHREDRLTFGFSSNIGYTRRNFVTGQLNQFNNVVNPFFVPMITPAYITPKLPNGEWNTNTGIIFAGPTYLQKTVNDKTYNDQIKAVMGLNFDYSFTKNIYAGLVTGIDFRETQNTVYDDPRTFDTYTSTDIRTRSGALAEALTRFIQLNAKGFVGYRNTFKEVHNIDVTGYAEYLKNYTKLISAQGFGIDSLRPNTPAGTTQGNASNQLFSIFGGGKSQRAIESLLGIVKYTYKDKYTVTGSYRYDGTSNLPEQNRFHGFYSIGAIWNMTRENFMQGVSFIQTLRLKYSRGQAANIDNFPFGDFGYLPVYTKANTLAGSQGIVAANPGNPEGEFEYTTTDNLGFDFSMFKNKFYGDIQVYNKVTNNLFAELKLSATSGFGSQDVNAGNMYNRGIEYTLNYDIIRNAGLFWNVFVNGAYNKNKVTSLGNAKSFETGTELVQVGLPLGSHYEVKWAGVDAASGAPLFYDKDGKVTNVYSPDNRVSEYGTWIPPYTGGFGTDVRYKGFELSTLFSYAAKTYRVNNLEFFVENPNFLQQGINQANTLNFWKKPGDVASTQSGLYQNNFTSKGIQDASFLRWRNVTLSYTFPASMLTKTRVISSARVYVLGQNLYTFSKWKGLDPEDDNNISLNEYPNPKAFTVGLEISF